MDRLPCWPAVHRRSWYQPGFDNLFARWPVVFLPQQQCEGLVSPRDIFSACVNGLSGSQIVVAVLDGADADSGTCWECGYAYAKGMKVVGLRTDVRKGGDDGSGLNLMLSTSSAALVRSVDELLKYLAGS